MDGAKPKPSRRGTAEHVGMRHSSPRVMRCAAAEHVGVRRAETGNVRSARSERARMARESESMDGAPTEQVRVHIPERGRACGETDRYTDDGRANDVHVVHLVFFPVVPVACGACGCANGMRVALSACAGVNASAGSAASSRQFESTKSWRRRSGSFRKTARTR